MRHGGQRGEVDGACRVGSRAWATSEINEVTIDETPLNDFLCLGDEEQLAGRL